MYKRKLTILICTLVIVGLLFAPFSLPARAVAGVDDALAGGLFLGFLAAMGLDFSFIGIDQNKEALVDLLQDLYNQFRIAQGSSVLSLAVAWASLQFSELTGGFLKIPNDTAADMADFADWLVDEYSLGNNDSSVIYDDTGYFFSDGSRLMGVEQYYSNGSWRDYYYDPPDFIVNSVYTINDHELYILSNGTNYVSLYVDGDLIVDRTSSHAAPYWVRFAPDPTSRDTSVRYTIYNSDRVQVWFWTQQGSHLTSATLQINGPLSTVLGNISSEAVYINTRTVDIPVVGSVDDIYVRSPGITDVFGGTVEGVADQMLEASLDEDLEASYELTDVPPEYPTPDGPTILNVFTDQLGSFFDTIWHYVSDLVDYSTPFIIVWRDQLMGAFPFRLMLPLYASFVLALFLGLYKVFRGVH